MNKPDASSPVAEMQQASVRPASPQPTSIPPMRHVLAATDFSALAQDAAARAARIAGAQGATLHLLHALASGAMDELRHWLGAAGTVPEQLETAAQAELQALAQTLQASPAGPGRAGPDAAPLQVQCHLGRGSVPAETLRLAQALPADLLVVGARGAGALRRLVLGTTADRLLRRVHQPVLVVRNPVQQPYRRVLVAVDFSAWSTGALQAARRVAPGVPLVLLSVVSVPFEHKLRFAGVDESTIAHYRQQVRAEALQRLHALAHDAGLATGAWSPCVMEGEAWQRIVDAEQAESCDLVVLGKQGRSATEDLLLGSVTRHVLSEGSADLLVCTAPAAA